MLSDSDALGSGRIKIGMGQIALSVQLPNPRPEPDGFVYIFNRTDLARLANELKARALDIRNEAVKVTFSPQGFLLQTAERRRAND